MADPANRQTNPAGGKFYVHPKTGERFDSVTTILDLVDKAGLKIWAGQLSAQMAIDHIPQLVAATLVPPCRNTYNRCYQKHGRSERCERCPCGECETCWYRRIAFKHQAESSRRAAEGTEVHQAIDFWIHNGGQHIHLTEPAEPYYAQFQQFVTDYGLQPYRSADAPGSWEQTEVTLLNRQHLYAGTSDGALWLQRGVTPAADRKLDILGMDRALVRVDYKTREKEEERLYNDHPLQGIAYDRCTVAMLPNGDEHEAPATHARAVLQMRPKDYSFKLMASDDPEFEAFLGVLTAYRWMTGTRGKSAFSEDRSVLGLPAPVVVGVHLPVGAPVGDLQTEVAAELVGATDASRVPAQDPPPPPASATTGVDPFDLVNKPAQAAVDAKRPARTPKKKAGNATLDSLADFNPGSPVQARRNEEIPF